jgi:hypothetical protein
VSEGAAKFSSVVTTSARDPEGGPVTYSISGGDGEGHFQIEESTGVVRVMEPLDREQISRYTLVRFYFTRCDKVVPGLGTTNLLLLLLLLPVSDFLFYFFKS